MSFDVILILSCFYVPYTNYKTDFLKLNFIYTKIS